MELRERQTITDKWKEHYRKKDQIFQPDPKSANMFGVGFFFYMCFILMFETFYMLMPTLYRDSDSGTYMTVFIWFVFIQTMLNWVLTWWNKVSHVDATFRQKHVSSTSFGNPSTSSDSLATPEGWKTCFKCQLDTPPRSHHCNICGYCILKRDHHCFFTASCIGFHNQRRFIVLLFYVALANITSVVLQFVFLNGAFTFLSWNVFNYIPMVTFYKWLTGEVTFAIVFIVIHLYLSAVCLLGTMFFLAWQLIVVFRGQTSYEAWKNITAYQTSILDGFRTTFGPYGLIQFVFPFDILQMGDGVNWKRAKRVKGQ